MWTFTLPDAMRAPILFNCWGLGEAPTGWCLGPIPNRPTINLIKHCSKPSIC